MQPNFRITYPDSPCEHQQRKLKRRKMCLEKKQKDRVSRILRSNVFQERWNAQEYPVLLIMNSTKKVVTGLMDKVVMEISGETVFNRVAGSNIR